MERALLVDVADIINLRHHIKASSIGSFMCATSNKLLLHSDEVVVDGVDKNGEKEEGKPNHPEATKAIR